MGESIIELVSSRSSLTSDRLEQRLFAYISAMSSYPYDSTDVCSLGFSVDSYVVEVVLIMIIRIYIGDWAASIQSTGLQG